MSNRLEQSDIERLAAPLRADSVLSVGWLPAQMMAREILALRKELEAARAAENERLRRERDDQQVYIEGLLNSTRGAVEEKRRALVRAEKAEAACVALRDKLRATAHQVAVLNQVHRDAFLMGSLAEIDESICKLLASTDPGAEVRAVVEAAKRHFDRFKGIHEIGCAICEAVRALRGKEGEPVPQGYSPDPDDCLEHGPEDMESQ